MEVTVRVRCVPPKDVSQDQSALFNEETFQTAGQQSIPELRQSLTQLADSLNTKLTALLQAQELSKPATKVKVLKKQSSHSDSGSEPEADD